MTKLDASVDAVMRAAYLEMTEEDLSGVTSRVATRIVRRMLKRLGEAGYEIKRKDPT